MTHKTNGYADASFVRTLIFEALPKRKAISAQEVYNVCIRAKMLMKKL